ncbi:YjjG family noncanonical pyrimidine nucleotidase [Winogradskyella immobilis]|uniref:YjjG family noncanonical pyrimidine nucleotidase n=1 Tax=Winogradskyella immobilis TaxID=2816852 RepID=A0ABS8EQ91_9FLAO|nr:YjjG family noncanonical pyrimidine nucleotidase [Winogradskyella immobilis]MCC1484715.1 YjjG family noncanonical pyrimidine nucleotidase [Winogradskyella immobilis]MCG0016807.1 YjjG family noncanonical pyrimidine nucleotidase [Winogradskyella immobilis]
MTNTIKHIFFDLDHTLWDFDKNSALTFEKIFRLHNIDVNLNTFLKVYEPINFQYWKLYREEKVSKEDLRYGRLKDAFNKINVAILDTIVDALSEDYIRYLTTFNHLFEGTIEILEYLGDRYQLHIITNGFKEAQEKKMIASNIKHYFKTITNSEMVGVKKPNPKIFNYALNSAKANVKESVMVGDNYEADVLGALNIGMDAICFNYHNEDLPNTIKRVNHLTELQKYF